MEMSGQAYTPVVLSLAKTPPVTFGKKENWVDPRASVEILEERNPFPLTSLISRGNFLHFFSISFRPYYGAGVDSVFNPLAPEFSLKFYHTLYLKCEYYRNQKR